MCASSREWAPPIDKLWIFRNVHWLKSKSRGWSLKKFHTRFRNLQILLKISGFPERFQDFMEISRFHVRFQDFQKDYARFPDFNEDFCKISRFQWRFLQDFQILVQILTYWFWISGWCDYLLHTCRLTQCTGRNLHSSIHYAHCKNKLVVLTTE